MTRFARAKGSKSSNERVPDEATPWSVMKMQLEDSQAGSNVIPKKAKTAKELLAEKDQPFYHNNSGNVNHEWAAFEDVPKSNSGKNKSGNSHETKNSKRDKTKMKNAAKLHLSNDNSSASPVVEVIGKNINQNGNAATEITNISESIDKIQRKTKTEKKNISSSNVASELDSQNLKESENSDESNAKHPSSDLSNSKDNLSNRKSDPESEKRAKKFKKSKKISMDSGQMDNQSESVTPESQESQEQKLGSTDSDKKESSVSNVPGNTEKLSKRQKRNQKKQKKIMSEKNEGKTDEAGLGSQKDQCINSFDVAGNDWSNEVKFGKHINSQQLSATITNESRDGIDKKRNALNKDEKNLEKAEGEQGGNDNSISENSKTQKDTNTQSKKGQKRKGGKNDNKEYKRRKPDDGVIKMIINGNEIEVVKYDGFPVKKEDADRLQELKKNMIIKGIPRSEINIAMKLERRKAEKALARERKRVCFHCRKSGHNLSDCPELGRDESGTGICFKCGSAEHTHFECRVVKGQEFRHASCFICREQGHIAKQCPDNPKGLYPQGGSCKICGDVTHLKKDCPDLMKEKEETNITADKIVDSQLESIEEDQMKVKTVNNDIQPKNKIIKF